MEKHMSIQLRIKLLSLSSEARHIRRWERRLLAAARSGKAPDAKDRFWSIRNHRKDDIAPEARATGLAHGFLRGRAYKTMEQRRYSDPDWAAIQRMATEYGRLDADKFTFTKEEWKAWRDAAGVPDQRFPSNQPPTAAANAAPATATPPAPAAASGIPRKKILGIF